MENLYALIFGLIGTGIMSLLLYLVGELGGVTGENVRGIGSSIPAPRGGSQIPGAMIHLAAGAGFGLLYLVFGGGYVWYSPAALLAFGAVTGIVRGIVVSCFLALIAFDQDPWDFMQRAGAAVGIWHVGGNVVYGLCVSLLFGLAKVDPNLGF